MMMERHFRFVFFSVISWIAFRRQELDPGKPHRKRIAPALEKLYSLLFVLMALGLTSNCQITKREALSQQLANPTPASSPKTEQVFVERSHTNARGETMPYLLFLPEGYDKTKQYPLVLWLHGGGTRGNDLKLLLGHGDQHGIGFLARTDNQAKYPSFILAPQCPLNRFWGHPDADQATNEMKLALEILDKVRKDYSVDSRRLYVMGMSLGGYGTWDILVRRPNTFAAAVPICGGGNPAKAALIARTPVWVFHGDEDESVNVSESRRMIAALKKAGGQPRYTEYKGVGHNSWVPAFKEPDFLSWIFAQRRSE